jgi:hypothetical protein
LRPLRPRLAVPIHWGTFHPIGLGYRRPSFLHEPPLRFARHAALVAPDVRVDIVQPGGRLTLAH